MAHPEPPTLALTLQRLRAARGLTQEELAERAGVSVRTISDLERNISRYPHRDTLRLLGEALALSPDEAALLQQAARHLHIEDSTAAGVDPRSGAPGVAAPLIGRAEECRVLREALAGGQRRLVTLVGPAGIGKTRLALEMVATWQSEFDESVCFVDLAPVTDAAYVASALAHALDVRESARQPVIETLVAGLADRRLLLALDNFEHVLDARVIVSALLARCPHVHLLVTSRRPLEISGEQLYPIPPLPTPDLRKPMPADLVLRSPATALFIERATAVQPRFSVTPVTARTIAKICARLGGIPLAIELAAAWAAQLAPQEILAQLSPGSGYTLLALLTRRTGAGPTRQRSMRDALAWSYHLLDAHEQVVFRRLSIFAGGWSLEAAEAICAPVQSAHLADLDLVDALTRLATHSLIFPTSSRDGSARFGMHTVIASYAQSLLDERKEPGTLARRHAEYFAELVEHLEQGLTGAEQQQSVKRLVDEYENIRAALRWTREHHELELGLRLAGALWWFWETRGYATEGREWVEGMLKLVKIDDASVPDECVARALYCATILAAGRLDYAHAEQFAREFLLKTDAPAKRARVLLVLGNIAKFKGERVEANALYMEGLAALRALNDAKGMLVALNNLSALAIEQGDLAQALPLVEESLTFKRRLGDRRGVAVSLMNLGEIHKLQGDTAAAQQTLEEGLQIFQDLDDRQGVALAWNNLGELAYAQSNDTQATEYFETSLVCSQQMEDTAGEARALLHLGETFARRGDYAQAERSLRASATLFETLNQPADLLASLVAQASVSLSAGQRNAAGRLLGDVSERLSDGDITLPQAAHVEYERLLAALNQQPAPGDDARALRKATGPAEGNLLEG